MRRNVSAEWVLTFHQLPGGAQDPKRLIALSRAQFLFAGGRSEVQKEREGPPDQKPGCCHWTQAGHRTALKGNEAASLELAGDPCSTVAPCQPLLGFQGLGITCYWGSQVGGSSQASGEEAFITLGPSAHVCVTYVFPVSQVETQVFILPFLHILPQGYGWRMKEGKVPLHKHSLKASCGGWTQARITTGC